MFENILGHAESKSSRKVLEYLSLRYGILTAQKPELVTPTDILGPPTAELRINHKLYE